jgi:hypothetical protein
MESLSRRPEDSDDFDFGDDWVDEDFIDPEDIPLLPGREQKEIDEYIENRERQRKLKKRRKEKHDKHRDDWDE